MDQYVTKIRTESGDLPIKAGDIEDDIVGTSKIKSGAVTAAKIAEKAVTTAKIKDGAVTAAKVDSDVATKAYVDSVTLPLTEGNLSGDFHILGDLYLGNDTNTLQYDLYLRRVIGEDLRSGRLYVSNDGHLGLNAGKNGTVVNYLYLKENSTEFKKPVSLKSGGIGVSAETVAEALSNLGGLSKAGGTMSGPINMGSKKITNLATPTNNADATTKSYVDGKVAGARRYGTVPLPTSWANGAQEIGVEGILATDMPHWGVVYSSNSSTREAEKEAFALVDELETQEGKFIFRCFGDVPTVALTIQWEVNR